MTAHIVTSVVLVIGTILLVRFLMRVGLVCQFCGKRDVRVWDRVATHSQKAILDYFRSHEGREPDTSRILVCDDCQTVFDDFSGLKGRGEVESYTVGVGPKMKTIVTCSTWCKVCNSVMLSCDPDNDNIHCRTCETHYQWKTHEMSGYRFLMPPAGVTILGQCSDELSTA